MSNDSGHCRWCGKTRDEHLVARPRGAPVPRMPCLGLRHGYSEPPEPLPLDNDGEYRVHQVKIRLCEACLEGKGDECHTPGCALFIHDSPGIRIHPELYEVVPPPVEGLYPEREAVDNALEIAKGYSKAEMGALHGPVHAALETLAAEVERLRDLIADGDFKDLYAEGIEMGKRMARSGVLGRAKEGVSER